jgi:hypothetical protein
VLRRLRGEPVPPVAERGCHARTMDAAVPLGLSTVSPARPTGDVHGGGIRLGGAAEEARLDDRAARVAGSTAFDGGTPMRTEFHVDRRWTKPEGGSTIPVVNPATEEVFYHIPAGSATGAGAAVRLRRGTLASPERGLAERPTSRIVESIRTRLPELARLEVMDTSG